MAEERITICQGSQIDEHVIADLADRFGPFDIVIDDGSHKNRHVIETFEMLFEHVVEGGWYIVEDLQTAYIRQNYGGSARPTAPFTSMDYFKRRVDGLNHAELRLPRSRVRSAPRDLDVVEVRFQHNLCAVPQG